MKTKLIHFATRCSLLCCFMVFANLVQAATYRSRAGGDWSTAGAWQIFNGSSWVNASTAPGIADGVSIRSSHTIVISTSNAFALWLTIDAGASLLLSNPSLELTVDNGNAAADFVVNGFFQDNGSTANGLNFQGGASWQLGPNGTFLKTNNASATVYRDNYHNGMQSIPPSANWIIRRISTDVTFSTVGTYYPNLTIENESGHWNPALGASRFQGASGSAEILGNFDVGGNGGGTVTVYNENTAFAPIAVYGNCTIRPGSTLTNAGTQAGTGFNFLGGLVIDGTLNITAGSGIVRFSGGGQSVIGNGAALLNQVEVQSTDAVYLQRPLTINNDLIIYSGKVVLQQYDLGVNGDIVGAGNNRYVQTTGSGYLSMPVNGSQYFPVGNNSFNPAIVQQSGGALVKVRVEDLVHLNGLSGDPITTHLVNRTWHLAGALSSGANLSLQWNAFDEWPGFSRGACYISHFSGGWQQDNPGMADGGGPYVRTRSNISGPGAFAVASSGILPVQLAWFKGNIRSNEVILEWQTWQEDQNAGFNIERSSDGIHFELIGFCQGAGSILSAQYYQFVDQHALPYWSYYRLHQFDWDGHGTYSPLIALNMPPENTQNLVLFPNPAKELLHIRTDQALPQGTQALIFEKSGRLAAKYQIKEETSLFQIDISKLPAGVYVLVIHNDEQSVNQQFIKI